MPEVILHPQQQIKDFLHAKNLPEHLLSDAFVALLLSILREPLLSSDSKYFIIQGMYSQLENMGYENKGELETFSNSLVEMINTFTTKNSFMG